MTLSVPAPDAKAIREAFNHSPNLGPPTGYRPLVHAGENGELVCDGWLVNGAGGYIEFDRDMNSVTAGVWLDLEPAVHHFPGTVDAYDACQSRMDIHDGDVLVIEDEGVVGIAWTWPFALTEAHGELHILNADPRTYEDGRFARGVPVAEREAARLGLAAVDRSATDEQES